MFTSRTFQSFRTMIEPFVVRNAPWPRFPIEPLSPRVDLRPLKYVSVAAQLESSLTESDMVPGE